MFLRGVGPVGDRKTIAKFTESFAEDRGVEESEPSFSAGKSSDVHPSLDCKGSSVSKPTANAMLPESLYIVQRLGDEKKDRANCGGNGSTYFFVA